MSPIMIAIIAALTPIIQTVAKAAADKLVEWLNGLFTKASKNLGTGADSGAVFDEAIRLTRRDRKLRLRQRVKRIGLLRLFKAVSPGLLRKQKLSKAEREEFGAEVAAFE